MVRIERPAMDIGTYGIAPRFLARNKRVVAAFADRFDIGEVEEQRLVALVRPLVIGDRGAAMVPVAVYDNAATALAGV